MQKKLFLIICITSLLGFFLLANDPLRIILDFMIAGIVPGTNIMLGFWPSIGVLIVMLWLLKNAFMAVRYQMIQQLSLEMNAEKNNATTQAATENIEVELKKRAVITART